MLAISPETVCYLIVKAREFDAKVSPAEPDLGSSTAVDRDIGILEDHADDPTFQELTSALESLNSDQLLDLVVLTWIGRGTYAKDQWDEARDQAGEIPTEDAPRYLLGTPQLGDYLEEGLAELGYSCQDYEIGRL